MLVFITTRKIHCDTCRQIELVKLWTHLFYNLAHWHTVYCGLHSDDALTVFALDSRRVEAFHYSTHVFDAHCLTAIVVNQDILNIVD